MKLGPPFEKKYTLSEPRPRSPWQSGRCSAPASCGSLQAEPSMGPGLRGSGVRGICSIDTIIRGSSTYTPAPHRSWSWSLCGNALRVQLWPEPRHAPLLHLQVAIVQPELSETYFCTTCVLTIWGFRSRAPGIALHVLLHLKLIFSRSCGSALRLPLLHLQFAIS